MERNLLIPIGKNQISGVLHLPELNHGEKAPVVVICHGFISNKVGQHRLFVKAARAICQAGCAVMRFDFSGCGESTGEYRDITLAGQIGETIRVIDYLSTLPEIDIDKVILLGHSLGGCIAASVAGVDARIARLILWSPVADPQKDIVGIIGKELYYEDLQGGVVNYQGFEIGSRFLASLAKGNPLDRVKAFGGDVLIVHGTDDAETPFGNARLYQRVLRERQDGREQMSKVDGADHTYNSPLWEKAVIEATLGWLGNENKYTI